MANKKSESLRLQKLENAYQAISESSESSSIYVGCDSKRFRKKGIWYSKYSTVVIVHKDSKHGGQIFGKNVIMRDYSDQTRGQTKGLKQRMLTEVQQMLEVFDSIKDAIGDRHFELHIDINSSDMHKSSIAVSEALGYVANYPFTGYEIVGRTRTKIKPEAWAATHAADHVVRK